MGPIRSTTSSIIRERPRSRQPSRLRRRRSRRRPPQSPRASCAPCATRASRATRAKRRRSTRWSKGSRASSSGSPSNGRPPSEITSARRPPAARRRMPPSSCDVAIVGAGAAGLATAIFARRFNPALSVVVLDGARSPGAKILVSGGTRCNVTNAAVSEHDFWGGPPAIVRRVLRAFPVGDTVAFFREIGVALHEEAGGKLFPDSNRARDVLDALLRETRRVGAVVSPAARVLDVAARSTGDRFQVATAAGELRASRVVLATGGRALPKSGSDGAGYEFAQRAGHTIVPTTPALVPLLLAPADRIHADVSGVAHDVELTVRVDGAVAI